MSFKTYAAAIAATLALAPTAYADGHESTFLANFSISGISFGDVVGAGSATTVFDAGKNALNELSIGTDTLGDGCGTTCVDTVGQANAHVLEMAFINSTTHDTTPGEQVGSVASIKLGAETELVVADTTLRDVSMVDVYGNVATLAFGDNVTMNTSREASAKVQNDMDFYGNLCDGQICGSVTQGTWAMGSMSQSAHTTASGEVAVAISNVNDGKIAALLENYKSVAQPAQNVAPVSQ